MITLRQILPSDKAELVRLLNNANVSRFTSERVPFPYTEKDGDEFFERMKRSDKDLFLAITLNGQLIGGAGVHPQILNASHVAEIGYWIGEEYWGKGHTGEAVKQLVERCKGLEGIKKLMAKTSRENTASCRILEKLGFKIEGALEKHFFKRGKYYDELVWGLLLE